MATNVDGKKISALTAASSVSASDQIIVETSAGTRKVRADVLAAFVAAAGMTEVAVTFNSKMTRYGGRLYKQGNHVHGTLYGGTSSNPTALTITASAVVDGLTLNKSNIYFCELATVSGNLFNLATSAYALVGVSPVRTTISSSTTTTSGPCIATYNGTDTIIYAYKGTTGTVTGYYADVVIDYLTD